MTLLYGAEQGINTVLSGIQSEYKKNVSGEISFKESVQIRGGLFFTLYPSLSLDLGTGPDVEEVAHDLRVIVLGSKPQGSHVVVIHLVLLHLLGVVESLDFVQRAISAPPAESE